MNLIGTTAQQIQVERIDWPRCTRCDMPVEDFQCYDTQEGLYFLAICHRATEVSIITAETLAGTFGVNIGHAFTSSYSRL